MLILHLWTTEVEQNTKYSKELLHATQTRLLIQIMPLILSKVSYFKISTALHSLTVGKNTEDGFVQDPHVAQELFPL